MYSIKKSITFFSILWLGLSAFGQISSYPYTQDFETFSTCTGSCQSACALSLGWNNPTVGDFTDWTVDVGGTSSNPTGPQAGDHTLGTPLGKYLYLESSSPCNGGSVTANLESPWFDFTTLTSPSLKFWYHMYGTSMGTMHVDVDTSNNGAWVLDVIPSWTDNQNLWQEKFVPFGALAAGRDSVRFRIRGVAGTSFLSDMAVDDIFVFELPPIDVGIAVIDSPMIAGCGLGLEDVIVTIVNQGSNTLPIGTVIPVCYNDGASTVCDSITLTTPLPAFSGTVSFTFSTPVNLSTPGDYIITAWTGLSGDGNALNDTLATAQGDIVSIATVSTLPYYEGFENGSGGWTSGGTNSSWAYGTFAGTVIGPGPSCGPNGWATNLAGGYNNSENSSLQSPCLDFSSLTTDPTLRFNHALNIEGSFDALWVETSTDGGATWTKLGVTGGLGTNWYNTGDNDWDGNAGWRIASHPLTGMAGVANAAIRFVMTSDGSVTPEGTGIDDLYIFSGSIEDGSAIALVTPVSACGLSAADTITAQFLHSGTDTIAGMPVCYILDNGPAVCDSIVGPFAPGAIITYSFTTPGNFSAAGVHTVKLYANQSADVNTCNDTLNATVTNVPLINSFPYLERFENGAGSWTLSGATSFTLGTPAKTVIQGAGSGVNAWVTGGLGTAPYNANENGSVLSPCFDMTAADTNSWVALKIWWNSEFSWDGSNLQYTTDDGATWTNIGALNDPFNWYNDNSINGSPGGSQIGWTGRAASGSGGYVFAKNTLPAAIYAHTSVRFRLTFGSDSSVQDDGVAWDDFAIGVPTQVSLGPDTTVCGGYVLGTDQGMNGQKWEWSTGETTPTIQLLNLTAIARTDTISIVWTDSLGLCTNDTVIITVDPAPYIDLLDITICAGGTDTLDASGANATSYLWSTSDTSSAIIVGPGSYAVDLSNPSVNGCTYTDSVLVSAFPVVNFVADTTMYCPGDTVTLDAGVSGASYLWSTGDTSQVVMVNTDGAYSVVVSDTNGCISSDTINTVGEAPADLGPNTLLCDGVSWPLDPGVMGSSYLWSTGDTTGTLTVSAAGTYTVTVTSNLGCVSTDSIAITTEVSPGAAFTAVPGGAGLTYTFTDNSTGATTWSWDFGDGNTDNVQNPSHTYATAGSFTVTLIVTNDCGSDTTTQPFVVVGLDNSLAEGSVNVYPNPNEGSFFVKMSDLSGETVIELYTLHGQLIQSQELGLVQGDYTEKIEMGQVTKGVYFVKVTVDGQSAYRQVVIQ